VKLRIYGSDSCEKCRLIIGALTLLEREFEFIDALSDLNQDLCDLNDVDALPHIQLLNEHAKIVWQASDEITLLDILNQLETNEIK